MTADDGARSGPFDGLRVLEISRLLPGAYTTLLLADLGADVIKVEEPGVGDYMRWVEPMSCEGFGAMFSASCRNKRSVTLNLKHPQGRATLLTLAAESDVVVEGFRPGVAQRLGVGYEDLLTVNPRLVYCSISGYGQDGPYAQRPGHDLNYLAVAGVLDSTGDPDGPPAMPGPQLADIWGGGLTAAFAIAAALWRRDRDGEGHHLDIAMYDGTAAVMTNQAARWLVGGMPFVRGQMPLSGGVPNYRIWRAKDGWVTLACTEEKFWRRACELLGAPELAAAYNANGAAADAAVARLTDVFVGRTRSEWDALLGGPETCFAPVLSLAEAMDSELLRARRMIGEVAVGASPERQLLTAVDRLGAGEHRRAPLLGEHTDEVLAALDVNDETIAALRADGAI